MDGSHPFLRHLGPFGCIKPVVFSENSNLSKNRFSEKIYTSVSTDHLEQKSTLLGVFHTYQYTKYVWKTPKIESHLVIFGCGNAGIRGILFKKNGYFFSKNPKKCKKWKKNIFFTFHRLLTTLTLGFWRKKIFKNFPNQFHIRISKFQPILKFCLGQRWCRRWRC